MKHKLNIILAVLLVAAVAIAIYLAIKRCQCCKDDPPPPRRISSPCEDEDKRTLLIFGNNTKDDSRKQSALVKLIQAFNNNNKCIEAQIEHFTSEEFEQKRKEFLSSKGNAKNTPGVFTWFAGAHMKDMIAKGQLANVTEIWNRNNLHNTMEASRSAVTVEHKQYGVPYLAYPWTIYYNKKVFDTHKIEQVPAEWDDLLKICKKLKENGIAPFTIGSSRSQADIWFDYLNLRINGWEFHTRLLDGEVKLTDRRVKQVLAKWRELIDARCYIPEVYDKEKFENHSDKSAMEDLAAGKAAMYLLDSSIISNLPNEERKGYGFFRFPNLQSMDRHEVVYLDTLHMPGTLTDERVIADAKAFLDFAAQGRWTVETKDGESAEDKSTNGKPAEDKHVTWKDVLAGVWGHENVRPVPPRRDENKQNQPSQSDKFVHGAANLAQSYRRDIRLDMPSSHKKVFQKFMLEPDRQSAILQEVETTEKKSSSSP